MKRATGASPLSYRDVEASSWVDATSSGLNTKRRIRCAHSLLLGPRALRSERLAIRALADPAPTGIQSPGMQSRGVKSRGVKRRTG